MGLTAPGGLGSYFTLVDSNNNYLKYSSSISGIKTDAEDISLSTIVYSRFVILNGTLCLQTKSGSPSAVYSTIAYFWKNDGSVITADDVINIGITTEYEYPTIRYTYDLDQDIQTISSYPYIVINMPSSGVKNFILNDVTLNSIEVNGDEINECIVNDTTVFQNNKGGRSLWQ